MTLSQSSTDWIDEALAGGPEHVRRRICQAHDTVYKPSPSVEGVQAWIAGRVEWPPVEHEQSVYCLPEALVRSAS